MTIQVYPCKSDYFRVGDTLYFIAEDKKYPVLYIDTGDPYGTTIGTLNDEAEFRINLPKYDTIYDIILIRDI